MEKNNNKKKYITLDEQDCMDYRTMAKTMTKIGYDMNHATARNLCILGIKSILKQISIDLNLDFSKQKMSDAIKSQFVHDQLADILYVAYNDLKKSGEMKDE